PGLADLWQRPAKLPLWPHLTIVGRSTARRLLKIALWLTFLPFEAWVAIDAAVRSLWRMLYSRERLLEWQTAAAVESATATGIGRVIRRMWMGPSLAVSLAILLLAMGAQRACV